MFIHFVNLFDSVALLPFALSCQPQGSVTKEAVNHVISCFLHLSFQELSRFLLPKVPYAIDIIPSAVNSLLEEKLSNNFIITFLALISEGQKHVQDLWSS